MQRYSAILKQNSYRLMRIVSNLLDIAKIESGYMEPNWEKIELVSHLSELIRSVEFYASQRNISISFVCQEKGCHIHMDSYMMERIILNLISNAIKHKSGSHEEYLGSKVEKSRGSKKEKLSLLAVDSDFYYLSSG
jgi:signal transduction histidine kinase